MAELRRMPEFDVLYNENRLKLIEILRGHTFDLNEICWAGGFDRHSKRPLLWQHLQVLLKARLIKSEPVQKKTANGKFRSVVRYSLSQKGEQAGEYYKRKRL